MCLKHPYKHKVSCQEKGFTAVFYIKVCNMHQKKNTKGNLVLQVLEMLFKAVSEKF